MNYPRVSSASGGPVGVGVLHVALADHGRADYANFRYISVDMPPINNSDLLDTQKILSFVASKLGAAFMHNITPADMRKYISTVICHYNPSHAFSAIYREYGWQRLSRTDGGMSYLAQNCVIDISGVPRPLSTYDITAMTDDLMKENSVPQCICPLVYFVPRAPLRSIIFNVFL